MDIPSAKTTTFEAAAEPEQVSRKRKPEAALGQQGKVSKPEAQVEAQAAAAAAAPASNAEPNTVFVKNLSFAATADDIREAFARFGRVREVRLVEKGGKSRGMAYVAFEPNEQVDVVEQVLAASSAPEIRGRPAVVKRSYVQTQVAGDKHTGPAWPTHPTTVYVSGLPADLTQEQLVAMFEGCGAIEEARLVLDKRTQQPKGTALVQFQEAASVEEALKLDGQQIGGGKGAISVSRSRFPAAQPTSASERVRPLVESKTKLTDFAPRIVSRKPKLAAPAPASSASATSAVPETSSGGSVGANGSLTNEQFRNLFK
jgi:RNA recognition motif-containing protein